MRRVCVRDVFAQNIVVVVVNNNNIEGENESEGDRPIGI